MKELGSLIIKMIYVHIRCFSRWFSNPFIKSILDSIPSEDRFHPNEDSFHPN